MTRPSPPPSAPWRSPRRAGKSSCTRWRTNTSAAAYQRQGDYRQAIDCFGQTVASLDGAQRRERFGQVILPAVHLPCLARLVPCRTGHVRRGPCLRGRRAPDCRGGCAPREPHACLMGGWSAVPPPRRPAQGAPPARTGYGHLSGRGPPGLFPLDGCGLGGGVHPGRARRRRHAAAHAGDGTDHCNGNGQAFRRSVVSPWVRRRCWLAAWRRHTPSPSVRWRSPVRTRNGATRRMPCASSATLRRGASPRSVDQAAAHYRQALALAEELGMRPLQAHCHLGLGTLYARIGQRQQAHAELSTAIALYRAMDMTFWLPQAEAALAQVTHHG